VVVLAAAWLGLIFFPSLLKRTRGGGARLRRPSTERTLRDKLDCVLRPQGSSGLYIPYDLAVDGARHTVLELQVHLGDGVLGEYGGIGDITCSMLAIALKIGYVCCSMARGVRATAGRRTDGGGLDHVADGESLYRLILGCASRAVGAADGLDVATTLLVTSVGGAFLDHFG
jgi:hypothetical protein